MAKNASQKNNRDQQFVILTGFQLVNQIIN